MGLISWLAAKLTPARAVESIQLVEAPALYYQHSRIGGALTPEDVSAILREADNGYMYRFADLANESRQKDCHLQAILGTREMAVAAMKPHVIPASKSKKDRLVAEWCQEWLDGMGSSIPDPKEDDPRDLRGLLMHLQSANYFGYAVAETLFGKDGKYVVPIGAVPIAPRRFCFDLAHGRLHFWDVQGKVPYPGTDLMEAFPGRFIQRFPQINLDVQAREGLARLLVWMALFRNWAIADWLKLAEIAWKPWRIATYATQQGPGKRDASKEDIAAAVKAVTQLTTNGVAVLPDTVEMVVEWAKRGGANAAHGELAAFLAAEMSKAVLGATLTVEQGRVGSNALGNVHNEVRHDIRDADAGSDAACLRRYLMAPAVRLNHGKNVAIPGLMLVADQTVDLAAFATAIKALVEAGLPIPAEWARDTAAIPHPKKGEETVGSVEWIPPDERPALPPPPSPGGPPAEDPAVDDQGEETSAEDQKKAA